MVFFLFVPLLANSKLILFHRTLHKVCWRSNLVEQKKSLHSENSVGVVLISYHFYFFLGSVFDQSLINILQKVRINIYWIRIIHRNFFFLITINILMDKQSYEYRWSTLDNDCLFTAMRNWNTKFLKIKIIYFNPIHLH